SPQCELNQDLYKSFLQNAPPNLRKGVHLILTFKIENQDFLRLNLLRFDLIQRQKIKLEISALQNSIKEIEQKILCVCPKLDSVIEAATLLQPILGDDIIRNVTRIEYLEKLSRPLYRIFYQALAFKNSSSIYHRFNKDNNFDVNILSTCDDENYTFVMNIFYHEEDNIVTAEESLNFKPSIPNYFSGSILDDLFFEYDSSCEIANANTYAFILLRRKYSGKAHAWLQSLVGLWSNREQDIYMNLKGNRKCLKFQEIARLISDLTKFISNAQTLEKFRVLFLLLKKKEKSGISLISMKKSFQPSNLSELYHSFKYVKYIFKHKACFGVCMMIPLCYPHLPSLFTFRVHSSFISREKRPNLSRIASN
ncbi:hypothetical protein MXB_966, partial [Myxobolus squamalis]